MQNDSYTNTNEAEWNPQSPTPFMSEPKNEAQEPLPDTQEKNANGSIAPSNISKGFKPSILAQLLQVFSSAFFVMGGLCFILPFFQHEDYEELFGCMAAGLFFIGLGIGLSIAAKKTARRKAAKFIIKTLTNSGFVQQIATSNELAAYLYDAYENEYILKWIKSINPAAYQMIKSKQEQQKQERRKYRIEKRKQKNAKQ